jgi:hypothetical protein
MSKSSISKSSFFPQPYPLYVWGMWVETAHDEEGDITGESYSIDRLTVVGWQDYKKGRVEPMVILLEWGVIPLKAIASDWNYESVYALDTEIREQIESLQVCETGLDFLVADFAIASPDKELFDALKESHQSAMRARRAIHKMRENPEYEKDLKAWANA